MMNNRESVFKAISEGCYNRQMIMQVTDLTFVQVTACCSALLQAAKIVRDNPYSGNSRIDPVYRLSSDREKYSILKRTESIKLRLEELRNYRVIDSQKTIQFSRPFSENEDHYGINPPTSKYSWEDVKLEASFIRYKANNLAMNYFPFFVIENNDL